MEGMSLERLARQITKMNTPYLKYHMVGAIIGCSEPYTHCNNNMHLVQIIKDNNKQKPCIYCRDNLLMPDYWIVASIVTLSENIEASVKQRVENVAMTH